MAGTDSTSAIASRLSRVVGRWREAAGLNQFQAAEKIGIDRVTYQRLEIGFNDPARKHPSNPTLSTLLGVARAMDRPLPELMADLMFEPPEVEHAP